MVEFVSIGWWAFFFRWLHIISGVMWIGHLWYFNFTQTPTMPKIPQELRPAVVRYILPEALFWFRWGAMATIVTGLILAWLLGFIGQALSLGIGQHDLHFTLIGFGMWLGAIMWFNVWFIIWPNQKKALGIVNATPDEKKKAARLAGLTSRVNTMLSVPMLYCMASASHYFAMTG
jgi:uncharacterized membrane protein